jgi:hypothetical protein
MPFVVREKSMRMEMEMTLRPERLCKKAVAKSLDIR